jgi:hypothetical protein
MDFSLSPFMDVIDITRLPRTTISNGPWTFLLFWIPVPRMKILISAFSLENVPAADG